MTKTEDKQYIVKASHHLLEGDAVFSSFSTSKEEAFQNIRKSLTRVKEGNILDNDNVELMKFTVLAVQSKDEVISLENGDIRAWTYN